MRSLQSKHDRWCTPNLLPYLLCCIHYSWALSSPAVICSSITSPPLFSKPKPQLQFPASCSSKMWLPTYTLYLQTAVTYLSFSSHLGTSLCSDNTNLASFAFLNLSLSYFPRFALMGIKCLLSFLLPSLKTIPGCFRGRVHPFCSAVTASSTPSS